MIKEHIQGILKAQLFIENNLDEELLLAEIAKVACMSPYHFHRIFHGLTGETVNAFVRRLRMEKAANKLRYTEEPVTDIALDSGYETPSSFSRAFQKTIGDSPKRYRTENRDLAELNKKITNKEKKMITPEITKIKETPVLFVRKVGSYEETPSLAWKELMQFAKENHLNLSEAKRYSISLDNPTITDEEKLRFDACLTAPKEMIEKGSVGRKTLRGGKYAVFIHEGAYEKLEETFTEIFRDWYPESKEKIADAPCFCEHLNMHLMDSNEEQLITKIYIPLVG